MDPDEVRRTILETEIAYIPQSAMNALNPTKKVIGFIEDVVQAHNPTATKKDILDLARHSFETVGLTPEVLDKYPFELSGGQMQRLMIARIFLLKPKILLADEPTSMIDACSRATILDYLMELRREIGMTIIFITHDISLAYYVSDTVYIMEHGKFVERGTADDIILHPKEEYTRRLISDVPKIYEEWDLSTV